MVGVWWGIQGVRLYHLSPEQGKRAELRLRRWRFSTEDIYAEGPRIFAKIIPFTIMLQVSNGRDVLSCVNW